MTSNVFVPCANSVGESLNQVPGQTCGPRELVTYEQHWQWHVVAHFFPRQMVTGDVWLPEFLVHICCFASSSTSACVKNLQHTYKKASRHATVHLSWLHQTVCWLHFSRWQQHIGFQISWLLTEDGGCWQGT